jgi:hypothetical protein
MRSTTRSALTAIAAAAVRVGFISCASGHRYQPGDDPIHHGKGDDPYFIVLHFVASAPRVVKFGMPIICSIGRLLAPGLTWAKRCPVSVS